MSNPFSNPALRLLAPVTLALVAAFGVAPAAQAAATIVIQNNDAAGVGFNDATAVAPVGGNAGTTLGQQRLIAFQAAATTWGATLDSTVTITIKSQWTALTCTATTAVLGSAGAIQIWRDFPGAPFASTWYNESLDGKLTGVDPDGLTAEINANFNVNLGNAGCLTGTPFYLGLDNNHGSAIDLVTVLTHEFAHGLGFQTFTSGSTGAPNSGFFSAYDHFLMDLGTGKSWLQMSNAERVTSALNTHKLAWNGPQVLADVPGVLNFGIPVLRVTTPAAVAGTYDVGTAAFGPLLTAGGITGPLLLANDGTAPTSDGCQAFPAGFFAGRIAVIDRGSCSFKTKTLNAQNANALAVIIVNNAAGSPAPGLGDDATITTTITIPTVSLTQTDGQAIEAQLGVGVSGTVQLDTSVRAGADPFGKALLFSPNPFQSGSSVSHFDTISFPNQLMEPAINGDLTHNVTTPSDLTYSEMRDVGWVAQVLPTTIAKTSGDNQNAIANQSFAVPFSVTTSPATAGINVTWTVNPVGGAGASFPSTGSRFAVTTTNALGVATAPALTANATAGTYAMNATVPGAGTATFTLTNVVPTADLAITKTDGVTNATAGGSVTYTITASNAGPSLATGATVADTFPASETCSWTCVGAGGGTCTASGSGNINDTVILPSTSSVTYTASCTVASAATGTLSNTATVTAPAGVSDPTPGNNSATDTDTVVAQADLAITKTDGVTTAIAGGSVTYTITASNAGPSNASGATVADTFPASETCTWTCVGAGGGTCAASGSGNLNNTVNLPSGGSVTYTASCTISAAATGTLSNTATVTAPAGVTDPTPGNNSATDSDTLAISTDLSITKTDGVSAVLVGGSLVYTITASNAGPSNATGTTVADTFPASETCTWTCSGAGGGTCTASGSGNLNDTVNLPINGSATYTVNCAVSAAATGTLSNTATVTAAAGTTDPVPGNNSSTDNDQVLPINIFADGFEDAGAFALLWIDQAKAMTVHDSGIIRLPVGATSVARLATNGDARSLVQVLDVTGAAVGEIQVRRKAETLQWRLLAGDRHGPGARSEWRDAPQDSAVWTLEISTATSADRADGKLVLTIDGVPAQSLSNLPLPRQRIGGALVFDAESAHWVSLDSN